MRVINKVIVMVRLEDGDEVTVSVKQNDGALTLKHKEKLINRMKQDIEPEVDNALYYTVRSDISHKKDNWKAKSYDEVVNIINDIFEAHL